MSPAIHSTWNLQTAKISRLLRSYVLSTRGTAEDVELSRLGTSTFPSIKTSTLVLAMSRTETENHQILFRVLKLDTGFYGSINLREKLSLQTSVAKLLIYALYELHHKF